MSENFDDSKDIGKYFEMDCEDSYDSYYNNDNDSKYTYNYEDILDDKNNKNKKEKHNQIDDYIKENLNNNNNHIINNISNNTNYNHPNINKSSLKNNFVNVRMNQNSINKNKNINNSTNIFNNNNNHFQNNSNSISNINSISNGSYNLNKNFISNSINLNNQNYSNNIKKLDDDELDDMLYPKICNDNNENSIYNILNKKNEPENKNSLNKTKILDNITLSSSSNDVQYITNEDFKRHFQEERYGPQKKIEIIQSENNQPKMPFSNYREKFLPKINIDPKKCFENFFMEDNNKTKNKNNFNNNKNNGFQQSKNLLKSSPNIMKNKFFRRKRKFSPLPKDKYRDNNFFEKLLINRVEKQILTDIYDGYQNKDDFDETYYYLEKIKNILNIKGVEEAMNYIKKIEPNELKIRILMESTYFFKQIVKEEVEFAENNGGRLILYKQPDYIFNQNVKYNISLSGKANQNDFNRKGRKSFGFSRERLRYNNSFNMVNKNKFEKEDYSHKSFSINPNMYSSPNNTKKYK